MRFIFGRGWVFCDETNGEDANGAAGGAAAVDDEPAGEGGGEGGGEGEHVDAGGEGGGAAAAPGAKKEEAPKDMKTAIDAALGYKKGPNGEALEPLTGKVKEEPKTVVKPAAKPDAGTIEKHANGAPKKNAAGDELDDKGQVTKKAEPPKAKTSAELQLTKEQLAVLKPEARQRFQDVMTTLKTHEGTIAKQNETIAGLTEARDAIFGLMKETKTTSEQFSNLLEFNGLLQSGDPKKLQQALKMVEDQRLAIYTALGIEPEGGGIDLLADFPDLKKQVDDAEITRAAALEIAQGRRERTEREQATQRQKTQQQRQTQTETQWKTAATTAQTEIDKWVAGLAKTDIDYKAKEDKLLAKVDEVLQKYPPNLWLSTLQMMYDGIVIQKALPGKQVTPLRPSGAKPGAKAPNSMLEAINVGLGYAGEAKG